MYPRALNSNNSLSLVDPAPSPPFHLLLLPLQKPEAQSLWVLDAGGRKMVEASGHATG